MRGARWMALVVMGLAGCSSRTSAAQDGTVTGTLVIPNVKAGMLREPLPGEVKFVNVATGAWVLDKVGSNGRFSTRITPGTYRVTCESPQVDRGRGFESCLHSGQTITVVTGKTTTVDTGFWIAAEEEA